MPVTDILNSAISTFSGLDKNVQLSILVILFLLTYFAIIWFTDISKKTSLLIALIPLIIFDFVTSFGSYVFHFPFFEYTINRLVLTLSSIDFIFNYGIWKVAGLPVFTQVSGTVALGTIENLFVGLLTVSDSIIEFFVIYYILKSFIDWDWSLVVSAAAVMAYSILISNPLKEWASASANVSHFIYFLNTGTLEQKIIVFSTLIFSFAAVVFLISLMEHIFYGVGSATMRPGMEGRQYEVSFTGISFLLALAYSVAVMLHPSWSWYVVLPAMVAYANLRGAVKGYADNRQQRNERVDEIQEAMERRY